MASKKLIIGLLGKKQSGKDTAASAFMAIYGARVSIDRLAFATALKAEVAAHLNISVAQLEIDKLKHRKLLQWWGTEHRRQTYGDTYWVSRVEAALDASTTQVTVITDVRFPNEAEMIKRRGGRLLRVCRPLVDKADQHASEKVMDGYRCNTAFNNGGSIDDLGWVVKYVFERELVRVGLIRL